MNLALTHLHFTEAAKETNKSSQTERNKEAAVTKRGDGKEGYFSLEDCLYYITAPPALKPRPAIAGLWTFCLTGVSFIGVSFIYYEIYPLVSVQFNDL